MAKITLVLEDVPEQGTVMIWAKVDKPESQPTQAQHIFHELMEALSESVEGFDPQQQLHH